MSQKETQTPPPGRIPFPTFDPAEISRLMKTRRSLFAKDFSGEVIPRKKIEMLLENAHWAPTHGKTEPWFFKVFAGDGLAAFGHQHAALYKRETPDADFDPAKYEKLMRRPTECSHFIAICMKRGNNPRIPVIEEICAVACAAQNIYLSIAAQGLAGYWTSGGMTFHSGMKTLLGLGQEDQVLGFFMLGMPKDKVFYPRGYRKAKWEEKVEWVEE